MLVLLLSLIAVQQSPITVELNHDQFTRGDRARVYLRAAQDGYLVVLHADPAGRIRVLFPRDPGDDDFIRGGKRQELVSRSNRDAFLVEADEGSGMVLAAWSADAFDHSAYVRTDHWDYRSLSAGTVKDDPLVVLLDVVQTMAAGREFEYDAVSYVVTRPIAARYSFGHPYHFGVGYGWYSPFYDPYCWDPFWSRCYRLGYFGYPYYRPYRYTYYRPYRPYWFNSGGFTSRRFVIPDRNRDRFAPVQPRPRSGANDGFVIRDRQTVRRTGWRSRITNPSFAPLRGRGWTGAKRSRLRSGMTKRRDVNPPELNQ